MLKNFFRTMTKGDDEAATQASLNKMGTADAGFIIPRHRRPGISGSFNVRQAGGYDPMYSTAEEAKAATVLAGTKFVSVGLATFSFMKAVAPAYDNPAITTLPSLVGVDAKTLLMGASTIALVWGISKLDTAVMHSMRAKKAAQYAFTHYGIENSQALKNNLGALAFRLGISIGSLGITVPSLLVTSSQATIDQYSMDKINEGNNNAIVQFYRGKLTTVEDEIKRLIGVNVQIDKDILSINDEAREITYTEAQTKRLTFLQERLQTLEGQKNEQQAKRFAEEQVRDAALERIRQEREGVRGSIPGCRPEVPVAPICDAAMADHDDSLKRLETITAELERIGAEITAVQDERKVIEDAAKQATADRATADANLLTDLRKQKEENQTALKTQEEERVKVLDYNTHAKNDPRFITYNPDMTDRLDAYVEYMQNEANAMEWAWAGFIALMIASMELGVFALSASRNANPGEVRGYMAEMVKMREAASELNKSMSTIHNQDEETMDEAKASHGNQKYVFDAYQELFAKKVAEAMQDPNFNADLFKDIMSKLNEYRFKTDAGNDRDNEEIIIDPHTVNGTGHAQAKGAAPGPTPS